MCKVMPYCFTKFSKTIQDSLKSVEFLPETSYSYYIKYITEPLCSIEHEKAMQFMQACFYSSAYELMV